MSKGKKRLTHGSLFSGIGGFDLAAEWAGWENVFHVEKNEFCQRVLKHHWPNAKQFDDVNTFEPSEFTGTIDVVSGGFPCQPFSTAGQRRGTDDERHLWPRMLEIVAIIRPRYVVGENVFGIVNWSNGLVFKSVVDDLEFIGYTVQSYCLPACAINAPHRRNRIFFVAKRIVADTDGGEQDTDRGTNEKTSGKIRRQKTRDVFGTHGLGRDVANTQSSRTGTEIDGRQKHQFDNRETIRNRVGTNGEKRHVADTANVRLEHGAIHGGMEQSKGKTRKRVTNAIAPNGEIQHVADTHGISIARGNDGRTDGRENADDKFESQHRHATWQKFPSQSPICSGNDGIPHQLDGITFSKWRKQTLMGYGNAVVPQLAWRIFDTINMDHNGEQ